MRPQVWAIIPTFRRPELLARALASLDDQGPALRRVVVVNNSSDVETRRVAAAAGGRVTLLDRGCNLGTAGGIGLGLHALRESGEVTHAWILDDDARARPGALAEMLTVAERRSAGAVAPLITDDTGRVAWFPGPLPQPAWNAIRGRPRPAEFQRDFSEAELRWNWAIWASLLIARPAIEAIGYPRMDLWSQFTDLDYTLRLTARFPGVLAPQAVCEHLPPVGQAPADDKIYWALQNGDYVCVRTRPGWRALRHLPGHHRRFLQHRRWRPGAWVQSLRAFFWGAVLGRTPATGAMRGEFQRAAAAFPQWGFRGEDGANPPAPDRVRSP